MIHHKYHNIKINHPCVSEYIQWWLTSGRSRISLMRGHQLPRGARTYDFAKISQNLYEIERIWTWGMSLASPLDLPLSTRSFLTVLFVLFHFVQKLRNLIKKLFLFRKVHVKDHVKIHVESSWLTIKVKSYAFLFKFMNWQYLLFSKKSLVFNIRSLILFHSNHVCQQFSPGQILTIPQMVCLCLRNTYVTKFSQLLGCCYKHRSVVLSGTYHSANWIASVRGNRFRFFFDTLRNMAFFKVFFLFFIEKLLFYSVLVANVVVLQKHKSTSFGVKVSCYS